MERELPMSELPPLSPLAIGAITIEPTDEFFDAAGVQVRAWKGRTAKGDEVVALVAGVTMTGEGPTPGLIPIPPPMEGASPEMLQDFQAFWRLSDELLPQEIELITAIARRMIRESGHGQEARRFVSQAIAVFVSGLSRDGT